MRIPIETFRLENGLLVTLSQDNTAPIVAVNLWYHVGSANEQCRADRFRPSFRAHAISRLGACWSERTFRAGTAGRRNTERKHLARAHELFRDRSFEPAGLALWLEADRMGALLPAMTQKKLDTQRDVVKNERRWSVDNQPYGTWWEKLPELAFPDWHPFHHSLIGRWKISRSIARGCRAILSGHFTPLIMRCCRSLVISSRGSAQAGRETFRSDSARQWKATVARGSIPPTLRRTLRIVVEDDVSLPRLYVAFRSPVFGSDGYYTASVTGAILG